MFYRKRLIKEIVEYGKLCGEKNYTPGYSGNISARYKDGLLITTSGSSNGYLKSNQIVYTDFNVLEPSLARIALTNTPTASTISTTPVNVKLSSSVKGSMPSPEEPTTTPREKNA